MEALEDAIVRDLWIDGAPALADGGARSEVSEPATGGNLADVARAGPADVARAVDAADRAFRQGPWPRASAAGRAAVLLRLAAGIRAELESLAVIEARNAGKPIVDARWEVGAAASCFEIFAGAARQLSGRVAPEDAPGLALVLRQPVGVCALIVPWNFPFLIAAWKVAPALAAGNCAVLKPASATPLTALQLGRLARDAGLPPGVLNVLPGPGASVGTELIANPAVRKISFTGDSENGAGILRAAAADIKRVSLELGGKSANIVFADADLDACVSSSLLAVFGNAGQDCCARSRVLVEESIHDDFVERFTAATRALRVGDPLDPETQVGSLISPTHRESVREYVSIGEGEGARRVCGGDPLDRPGAFLAPAVFDRVETGMRIAQEEIFGPVVAVLPFRDEEQAVALANDTPYGLSGSLWTRDGARALRVARAVETGVLSVNSNRSVHVEAPFGGWKRSGLGRELGPEALESYTEVKTVYLESEDSQ